MTIIELKKAASEKDKVTQRAIGYRAETIKSKFGPFQMRLHMESLPKKLV